MKILLASSEVHPYSKTGGLADMVGALGKALARLGHQVGLVTPLYAGVRERFQELQPLDFALDVPLGIRRARGEVWTLQPEPGLTLYFVEQPEYYQRAGLYQRDGTDYPDNAERFIFFSKAVAELALHLPWKPEIVHAHDWQAAFAVLQLHHLRQVSGWTTIPRTCLTIHNLAFQGVFPVSDFALTNLPWDFYTPAGVEFYGKMNCLKGGIVFADLITTVSPRYAREITTEEFGCGLDGLLRERRKVLAGILNGVDYGEWDPLRDPAISQAFNVETLSGRQINKTALQKEFGLPEQPDVPLFGNIGRLAEQKGVDILLEALRTHIASSDVQFVLLGSGAPGVQRDFQRLTRTFPDKIGVHIGFDETLSHRIEAGADFFVMPSRFEPCGLNQMYSLRYGAVPIVRAVGGLDDSVTDPREDVLRANGIKFQEYSTSALTKALQKAIALYREKPLLETFRRNGMLLNFSWDRTATHYETTYRQLLKK